jgi:hypothetical protein
LSPERQCFYHWVSGMELFLWINLYPYRLMISATQIAGRLKIQTKEINWLKKFCL